MGLKPCKECKRDVSTSAKQCPHCGRRHPTGGLTLPVKIFLGFVGLVVVGQALAHLGGSSSVSTTPSGREQLPPAIAVSADQLVADYHGNEVAADSRYKGRVLGLTGVVDGINKDFLDKTYLTLRTANMFMTVHAQLKSSEVSRAGTLSKGDRVQLVCKGKGMIIGSPVVDECYFS
jgi:putative nucleic acid binding protein